MATEGATGGEWTIRRVLEWTIGYLKEHGSESPRLEAEILLAHAKGCRRIQLYTQYDEPLSNEHRAVMRDLVKRRAAAEPVAYLVGHREFFSLDFIVNKDVLIPRPDTETLVLAALDIIKAQPAARVLDLCTGSGCVAVSIAVNAPRAAVTATELHPPTAEVARQNIAKHDLSGRIDLLRGDLFAALPQHARFDVIVSNPPYVMTAELAELSPDVRLHEPQRALDGGKDGLDLIRRIIAAGPQHLAPGGWLLIELDPAQVKPVLALLERHGFQQGKAINDLSGQGRVVQARWNG